MMPSRDALTSPPARSHHGAKATSGQGGDAMPAVIGLSDALGYCRGDLLCCIGPSSSTGAPTAWRSLRRHCRPGAGGAVQMVAQREAMAVDDQHPLGAIAFLGEAHLVAAFLGGRERAAAEGHEPIELALPVAG